MQSSRPAAHDVRTGLLLAAGAAVLCGAAYPATAVALRSFTPLGIAAIACTIALPVVIALAFAGVIARPSRAALNLPSLVRLLVLTGLGGIGFIAALILAGIAGASGILDRRGGRLAATAPARVVEPETPPVGQA